MVTPVENNIPATPTPNPGKLTPEAVIEQLRTLQSQIDEVTPLSKKQREQVRTRAKRQPAEVVRASISVIGSSGTVAQAVGQPIDDVLQLQSDAARWALVSDELRTFLKGVDGANLLRHERLALIASQAYSFGTQLVRNPDNAGLVPQVEEIKRLKVLARRKKAPAQPPSPVPAAPVPTAPVPATPGHDTSTAPKT